MVDLGAMVEGTEREVMIAEVRGVRREREAVRRVLVGCMVGGWVVGGS